MIPVVRAVCVCVSADVYFACTWVCMCIQYVCVSVHGCACSMHVDCALMHVCMHACHVCMYICMYVCVFVCIYTFIYICRGYEISPPSHPPQFICDGDIKGASIVVFQVMFCKTENCAHMQGCVVVLIIFRVLNALCAQTYFVPDEYWQVCESHKFILITIELHPVS